MPYGMSNERLYRRYVDEDIINPERRLPGDFDFNRGTVLNTENSTDMNVGMVPIYNNRLMPSHERSEG